MEATIENVNNQTSTFISRVSEFDTDTKNNMMNGLQYCILSLVPIIILTKLSSHLFSSIDANSKGSIELLAEILLQLVVVVIAVLLIHKVIGAIPTYSGAQFVPFNYTTFAVGYLFASFVNNHCNLADKIGVLISRLDEAWSGKKNEPETNKTVNKVIINIF